MNKKSAFIALIGSPNAGKSTLLNKLIGEKLSIVSPKPQTTRNLINGIMIEGEYQFVFVDTPGITKSKTKLEKIMVKNAWSAVRDVDLIALLVDSKRGMTQNIEQIINELKSSGKKAILLLNKIDLVKKNDLLTLADRLNKFEIFTDIFMISALTGHGLPDLFNSFKDSAKVSPWPYVEDEITNVPTRFMAAELVREQLFIQLDEELPYNLSVDIEKWEEVRENEVKIYAVIYTAKDSHKKIILGKAGSMIKEIGQAARMEMEEILGHKVHLFLFVKVKENFDEQVKNDFDSI